jgi:hypothetical protein
MSDDESAELRPPDHAWPNEGRERRIYRPPWVLRYGFPSDVSDVPCWLLWAKGWADDDEALIPPVARPTVAWLQGELERRAVDAADAEAFARAEFAAEPSLFTGETTPETER